MPDTASMDLGIVATRWARRCPEPVVLGVRATNWEMLIAAPSPALPLPPCSARTAASRVYHSLGLAPLAPGITSGRVAVRLGRFSRAAFPGARIITARVRAFPRCRHTAG